MKASVLRHEGTAASHPNPTPVTAGITGAVPRACSHQRAGEECLLSLAQQWVGRLFEIKYLRSERPTKQLRCSLTLHSTVLFLLVFLTFEIKHDTVLVSCLLSVFAEEPTSLKETTLSHLKK